MNEKELIEKCAWCNENHHIRDCKCSDAFDYIGEDPIRVGTIVRLKEKYFKAGQESEREQVLNELEEEVKLHYTGKCGVTICDECKELGGNEDICLKQILDKIKELKTIEASE